MSANQENFPGAYLDAKTVGRAPGEAGMPRDLIALLVCGICLIVAVVSVKVIEGGFKFAVAELPHFATPLFIVFSIIACAFAWVRWPDEAPYLKITTVGCNILIGLNILWLGFDFPVVNQDVYDGLWPVMATGHAVAVVATVLSIFRPSFTLVVAALFVIEKHLVTAMAGGLPGWNHYVVLIDTMILVGVALIAFEVARLVGERLFSDATSSELSAQSTASFYYLTVMCIAIGVHFGNYFLSGYGKIALDGGVTSWLFENKTQYLMLAGYNLGASPISFSDTLFGFAYESLSGTFVLLNAAVLFLQFCCFMAFFRKEVMLVWVIFFDLMHLTIFLLTGALFIHWIVLNMLLVASVAKMPKNIGPRAAIFAGVFATIVGHYAFNTVRLAWYDNRQVRETGFVAVFADGSEAKVPPAFFRESAYTFYNRWFLLDPNAPDQSPAPDQVMEKWEWPAQTIAWGQVFKAEPMRQGEVCAAPTAPTQEAKLDFDYEAMAGFIQARQEWVTDRVEQGRALNYMFFPHDHFTMPWKFNEFRSADVKDIVAYYFYVETVCLDWEDGEFKREVITRSTSKPFGVKGIGDDT